MIRRLGLVSENGRPYGLHSLRQFVATQLYNQSKDWVQVARFMGHRDPSITIKLYATTSLKRASASSAAWPPTLGGPPDTSRSRVVPEAPEPPATQLLHGLVPNGVSEVRFLPRLWGTCVTGEDPLSSTFLHGVRGTIARR